MKTINFLVEGLGYENLTDVKLSLFGFMMSKGVLVIGAAGGVLQTIFGLDSWVLFAFALLLIAEWLSGVMASRKRAEKHESKKLGRMLFKIFVYGSTLFILNTFATRFNAPAIYGFELNPFPVVYGFSLVVIIWQLFVSYLENLDDLGYPWAGKLCKILNKKFYQKLHLEDEQGYSEE